MRRLLYAFILILGLAGSAAAQVGVLKNTTITAADQSTAVKVDGIQSVGIDVVGAGTYTLTFQGSMDNGATYFTLGAVDSSDYSRDTTATAPGKWWLNNYGLTHIRVYATSYTSGTPVVRIVRGYGGVTVPLSAGSLSGANDAAGATGAAVPSSASYNAINVGGTLRGQTGTSVGSQYAAAVQIMDGSGVAITSFGGGTQYAEDAAHASGNTGTMALGVRMDTPASLAGTDGDYTSFGFSSAGRLWASATIDAALPAGTNDIGNVNIEIGGSALAANNPVPIRLSNGTSFLTPSQDVTEDAAEAGAETGPLTLTVRRDTPASSAGTSGDFATLNTSSTGALYTQPIAGSTGGASVYTYISVGTTEDEHAVKASGGTLYSVTSFNTNAAARYLKCEDDTAANTAPGTDTPEFRFAIPGNTAGAGFTTSFPTGAAFTNALTCWIVTGAADSDVAEVAANEIIVLYTYK